MEIFVTFKTREDAKRVEEVFRLYGWISARDGLQIWSRPYDLDCSNDFTDWLDEQGIEYESV